jgi:predicted DNA-binding transcriptional regulator AlpA
MLPVLIKATLLNYFINQIRSFDMSDLNVISRKEICKQIGISRDTLKNWIRDRNFPKPLKSSGREPLFDQFLVKEWLMQKKNDDVGEL